MWRQTITLSRFIRASTPSARMLSTQTTSETVKASAPSAFPWSTTSVPENPNISCTATSTSTANPIQYQHEQKLETHSGQEQTSAYLVRTDWTREEIHRIYHHPLLDLIYHGATAHRQYFNPRQVQQCTLLSIKTGGCPEDCKYCSQSSRYETSVKAEKLMDFDSVLENARRAKEAGSTRFCMGAAWRGASQVGPKQFQRVVNMVSQVRDMGLEVCATLGMLNSDQAKALKEAGLTAYNHNLDTSREYYPKIITSRVYEDRLKTLDVVRDAGISVCCGGIIGLGETHDDRISLLHTLSTLSTHPESVPVNALVANKGTPLEDLQPVPVWELCRMIATARIIMPATMVRLSAGRVSLSKAEQALCFMAGANSIFTGDKLLTTPNPEFSEDNQMFETLGLTGKKPFFYEEPLKERDRSEQTSEIGRQ